MRLNKYVAAATGMSRRAADSAITQQRILVNGKLPELGQTITESDTVTLDGSILKAEQETLTIMFNKPVGYVCSRDGQESKTIYDILPANLHHLKPIGRLDKNSSGLLLLTNDGDLAYQLTHPKFEKQKRYKIALNKDLSDEHFKQIITPGVRLEDGLSKLELAPMNNQKKEWKVVMSEGRNRQIRRTFEALGYRVVKLHRTHFGKYLLDSLPIGTYTEVR